MDQRLKQRKKAAFTPSKYEEISEEKPGELRKLSCAKLHLSNYDSGFSIINRFN